MALARKIAIRPFLATLVSTGLLLTAYCLNPLNRPAPTLSNDLFSCSLPARFASRVLETGQISYYSQDFQGKETASGVDFNKNAFTAAHPKLPFNTRVRVTNLENGKSVVVTINDRGPFVKNRILDLSEAAAKEIGLTHKGTARAKVAVL